MSHIGWLTLLAGPISSFGFSLLNVNIQSLISLESKPEEQGIVFGLSQSFGAMARVIGPLAGGAIATVNLGLPYIVSGLLAIVIFFFGQSYLRFMKANKNR